MNVIISLYKGIANQRKEQCLYGDFLPRFMCLPTRYVPIETSSKIAAGPLASGDPHVTLSHVDYLPQALVLDSARPLVALHISLY